MHYHIFYEGSALVLRVLSPFVQIYATIFWPRDIAQLLPCLPVYHTHESHLNNSTYRNTLCTTPQNHAFSSARRAQLCIFLCCLPSSVHTHAVVSAFVAEDQPVRLSTHHTDYLFSMCVEASTIFVLRSVFRSFGLSVTRSFGLSFFPSQRQYFSAPSQFLDWTP